LVLMFGLPTVANGQAVRGVVLDDRNGEALFGASVSLLFRGGTALTVEADPNGRFFLDVPSAGEFRLEVSNLGYETARSQPLLIEAGDTLSIEFRVLPEAVLLRPLVVTARSNAGRNLFVRRQEEWGRGVFLSPADVTAIQPRYPADVFRYVDAVQLLWGWGRYASGSSGPLPRIRSFLGRGCFTYMVDGVPLASTSWDPSNPWAGYQLSGLRGEDVVALEVYRYPGEVPPELRTHADRVRATSIRGFTRVEDNMCGLAVIWTRAGW
jgi:Carboxypeptidase regulatory-like domain